MRRNAVGPADLVVQVLVAFADQEIAGPPLVVDQHRHDVADLLDQVGLALAQRDLVADLVEIAHGLRALAVQAADGQADFLQAAEDLVDLPRDHQGRQVQHHAHAHAGAHVRGAGGQIAQLGMEGERHLVGDQRVDAVDLLPGVLQIEPAVHHLDPQVVFLVDHQADLLAAVDGHAAGPFALGVLAADQLPLDQELAVDALELVDVDVLQLARLLDLQDAVAQEWPRSRCGRPGWPG